VHEQRVNIEPVVERVDELRVTGIGREDADLSALPVDVDDDLFLGVVGQEDLLDVEPG